ncbi:hypothetical protein TrLO_g10732 [Triparma laevis f. longispina]|uniref:Uncharacterized protein n=1 Tax=Triparma laevis f. longispina TaxID=1714387 RepID=A0A9W7DWM5_9STRA|nr:hypothetical protein TrLO_g10732 [Triparma laevis f. longispina]
MKSALFLAFLSSVSSFSPSFLVTRSNPVTLHAEKKLTAADIIAKARKAAGVATEDEPSGPPPSPFDDETYDSIQRTLDLIGKRVTEASGTRNTYDIPGMAAMSPEEYRLALQNKVIKDQQQRRIANAGVVGNRAAMSYLDDLNGGEAPEEQRWDTGTSSEVYAAEMERRNREGKDINPEPPK